MGEQVVNVGKFWSGTISQKLREARSTIGSTSVFHTSAVVEGSDVRVTGEIAKLVVTEIERDYGINLADEIEVKFRDKPIVIARSIDVLDAD